MTLYTARLTIIALCLMPLTYANWFNNPRQIRTVLHGNYKSDNQRVYVPEFIDIMITCEFTENYQGSLNSSLIEFAYTDAHGLLEASSEIDHNDTAKSYIIKNISNAWLDSGKDHTLADERYIECALKDCTPNVFLGNHCRHSVTIEIKRKPLPIKLYTESCVIDKWMYLSCDWLPTFKQQRYHTGMMGFYESVNIIQTIDWILLESPHNLPVAPVTRNIEQSQFSLAKDYEFGAIYSLNVTVQLLGDEHLTQSAQIIVNTSQIVKLEPVKAINIQELKSNSSWLYWTLPELRRDMSIEVHVHYRCESVDLDLNGCNINHTAMNMTRHIVSGLIPYMTYRIYVNLHVPGSVHWSNTSIVLTTEPAVPVVNPQYKAFMYHINDAQHCKDHHKRTVTVYWEPVPKIDYFSPKFQYLLEYKAPLAYEFNAKHVIKEQSQVNLEFNANAGLEVKIASANAEGVSSKPQETTISVSVKGSKVKDLIINSENGTSVTSSWQMPQSGDTRQRFVLVWCTHNKEEESIYTCLDHVSYRTCPVDQSDALGYTCTTMLPPSITYYESLIGIAVEGYSNDFRSREEVDMQMGKSKRNTGVVSGGIVWADQLYLDTKGFGTFSLSLETNYERRNILAQWTYNCGNFKVCALPKSCRICLTTESTIHTCKERKEAKCVAGSCKFSRLDMAAPYEIKLEVKQNNEWKTMATNRTSLPHLTGLTGGKAAAIAVCSVLFVLIPALAYTAYRYTKKGRIWFRSLAFKFPEVIELINTDKSSSGESGTVSNMNGRHETSWLLNAHDTESKITRRQDISGYPYTDDTYTKTRLISNDNYIDKPPPINIHTDDTQISCSNNIEMDTRSQGNENNSGEGSTAAGHSGTDSVVMGYSKILHAPILTKLQTENACDNIFQPEKESQSPALTKLQTDNDCDNELQTDKECHTKSRTENGRHPIVRCISDYVESLPDGTLNFAKTMSSDEDNTSTTLSKSKFVKESNAYVFIPALVQGATVPNAPQNEASPQCEQNSVYRPTEVRYSFDTA